MVSTTTSGGSIVVARHRVVRRREPEFKWPELTFWIWFFVMIVSSSVIMGILAVFVQIQGQLLLPIPWYFPYYITVVSLVMLWLFCLVWLYIQGRLLPAIVMIGAFVLFILWLVGLVVISIELWGPKNSVNGACNIQVFSNPQTGDRMETLAWLQQRMICQSWHVLFAFSLLGQLFLVWVMVIAYEVFVTSMN